MKFIVLLINSRIIVPVKLLKMIIISVLESEQTELNVYFVNNEWTNLTTQKSIYMNQPSTVYNNSLIIKNNHDYEYMVVMYNY